MKKNITLSTIIPAYNEEKNLKSTVEGVVSICEKNFIDYEILIFDDCSFDKTGIIADNLQKENSHIKVFHNKKNKGFGYNYRKGVELAKMDYIAMVPGDNEILEDSIFNIFELIGTTDILIPYTVNSQVRPILRRIISFCFTAFLNLLFSLNLKYYNGPVVYRKDLIKSIKIESNNFAFQAEALIQLIKKGYNFIEIEMYIKKRSYGKSKALKLNNIMGVLLTIIKIFKKVYFQKK